MGRKYKITKATDHKLMGVIFEYAIIKDRVCLNDLKNLLTNNSYRLR